MKTLWGLTKVEFFIAVVGLVCGLYFFGDVFYRKYELENNANYTMGQIVNTRIADGKLWLEYEFYADNIPYKDEVPEDGRTKAKIGDRFTVKYSRRDPDICKIILYEK